MSCCDCSPAAILVDEAGDPLGVPGNPINVTGVAIPQPVDVVIVGGGLNFDPNMADAFGRLRVSNPQTLFDSKQVYNNQDIYFLNGLTGAATAPYTAARASTYLTVTSANGDQAIRQTKRYFNYQPGKSALIFQTFVFGEEHASLRRRAGYFDANNGIFLEQTDADVRLVQRSNVSGAPSDAVFETQNNWNLDPLNGLGPSGEVLDLTKPQILVIDYEWLGVGLVRVGFVMPNDGIVYAHVFKNPNNVLTSVYMQTPNLPVRWEITRTAAGPGGDATLEAICCSVMSEGGQQPAGIVLSADRGTSTRTVPNGSYTPLIAIRLKSALSVPPVSNANLRRTVFIVGMDLHDATTNGTVNWRLLKNPIRGAGTAPSWVSADANSSIEYDVTSTEAITGGQLSYAGYAAGRVNNDFAQLPEQFILGAQDIAGTIPDEYVLAARTVGGGTDSCLASVTWTEL